MGFLLFAFRKLSLKRTISQKEFRQVTIANRITDLQEQQSIMAQAKTSAQNALSMFFRANGMMADNLYQSNVMGLSSSYNNAQAEYQKVLNDNNNDRNQDAVTAAEDKMKSIQLEAQEKYQSLFTDYQKSQNGLAMSQQVMNSIFTSSDKLEQENLHLQETQLEQENTSLETQLKLLREQLAGVEKGEDQAAKDVAPKFGLA